MSIKGYRKLTEEDIANMNLIKEHAETIGKLVTQLKEVEGIDKRWLATGTTDLQTGFMKLGRAVAQPTTF